MHVFQCLIFECGDDGPFLFPNIISTKQRYYPKCILNGNCFKFVPIKVSHEEQVIFFFFPFVDIVKGCNKLLPPSSLCAGSLVTNGQYMVSTYLIYITCIMYSIWDISFSGLAVPPNTHSDQHIL